MWLLIIAACGKDDLSVGEKLDTSDLWPVSEGRFQAFRLLDPGSPAGMDTGLLDDELLLALFSEDGCSDGTGLRMALRRGESWETASPDSALEFTSQDGLAICAFEDDDGSRTNLDPPVALWTKKDLHEGEVLSSGSWTTTSDRLDKVATYFGVFNVPVSFAVEGPDSVLDGTTLVLAGGTGIVVIESRYYTADLAWFR